MNMEENFDFFHGDAVVERGYTVYEEWNKNNISSRKIVRSVERAVSSVNGDKIGKASVEALALLFALELRVKERYNGIVKRLLGYFSLRRERRALQRLKLKLNISDKADIRDVIEVELEKIRERINAIDPNAVNNENRGGKQNDTGEEELEKDAERSSHDQKDDDTEEIDVEERDKEQTENEREESGPVEAEVSKQNGEKKNFENKAEFGDLKSENRFDREKKSSTEYTNFKNENNGAENVFEPKKNIADEVKNYNSAEDYIPLVDRSKSDKEEEKLSFIDEVIIDNMIKGVSDIIGHNPLEDVRRAPMENVDCEHIIVNTENGGDKDNDKDAHLYDKAVLEKNGAFSAEITEADGVRIPIQVDTETPSTETVIRRGITDSFTEEEILERMEIQEAEVRRRFSIHIDELGLKDSDFEQIIENRTNLSNVKNLNERK